MRPRLIAVDNVTFSDDYYKSLIASMRPRLIAVDNDSIEDKHEKWPCASMRPRLIAVDNSEVRSCGRPRSARFNEATADCRG